jgi:hypothetical protein
LERVRNIIGPKSGIDRYGATCLGTYGRRTPEQQERIRRCEEKLGDSIDRCIDFGYRGSSIARELRNEEERYLAVLEK